MARLFAVAAVVEGNGDGSEGDGGGQAIFFLLDAEVAGPSVRASPPLRLAAMGASATVRLAFDGLFVPDGDVVRTIDLDQWRARDGAATSQPHPAAFGLAATAIGALARRARQSGQAAVDEAAGELAEELEACRARSYGLSDLGRDGDVHLAALVEARAWGLDLAMRSAQAFVAATGGAAMALDNPAQRLVREAAFWSIQAQSASLRAATLSVVSLVRPPPFRPLLGRPGPPQT